MAHFYEYLEFNTDEDRENQLDVYVNVQLSPETEARLKALDVQGEYLVMAEPFCPDCVEVVAYFQKMAKLNPNLNVRYVSRKEKKERKHYDSEAQQQVVMQAEKIPSIFRLHNGETTLVLSEFPASIQQQMAANPEQKEAIRNEFRQGNLGKQVETDLLAILTNQI